jgi:hypothetical protein
LDVEQTLQIPQDVYGDNDGIRRFECPAGFFRLRRNCYYLSGGTAPWREAHFQCTARNSTLAVLNRYGKDKILRKYLMGDQFRKSLRSSAVKLRVTAGFHSSSARVYSLLDAAVVFSLRAKAVKYAIYAIGL